MHPFEEHAQASSRRQFFQRSGFNLGAIALGSLLAADLRGAPSQTAPLAPPRPHFTPRAKLNVSYSYLRTMSFDK